MEEEKLINKCADSCSYNSMSGLWTTCIFALIAVYELLQVKRVIMFIDVFAVTVNK